MADEKLFCLGFKVVSTETLNSLFQIIGAVNEKLNMAAELPGSGSANFLLKYYLSSALHFLFQGTEWLPYYRTRKL